MPVNDIKVAQIGWKHLVKAYRKSIGDEDSYAAYNRLDIYHRFLAAGVEEKGSYAYLFAEQGKETAGGGSFNFGNFILPNFLNLSLKAELAFQTRKVFLPLLHRTFAKELKSYKSKNLVKWTTKSPFSFIFLEGTYRLITTTLSGEAGFQIPEIDIETGIDTLEIGFDVGISVGGQFSGHFFATQDDYPTSYNSAMSKNLIADFNKLFGDDQFLIIDDFMRWNNENFDKLKPLLETSKLKLFKDSLWQKLPQTNWVRSKQNITKEDVKDIIQSLHLKISKPEVADRFTDSKFVTELNQFYERIVDAEKDQEPQREIKDNNPMPGYCFLDLLSLSPVGEGKFGAGIKAKIFELKSNVDLGTNVSITGRIKTSYSRFQNIQKSQRRKARLVLTQDTVVSYEQIKVEGNTSLKLPKIRDREKNLNKFLYNHMNYYAASSLWMPGESKNNQHKLKLGSGVTFGYSVRFGALFDITKSIRQENKNEDKLIKKFAKKLKVEIDCFKEFVSALFSNDDLLHNSSESFPQFVGENADFEYVLLESAFLFKNPPSLASNVTKARKSITDPIQTKQFKKIFKKSTTADQLKEEHLELESIRVRVRLADHYENPDRERFFHLGFSFKQTGLKFTIDTIRDAGNESIFSLFTYFFENSIFKDNPNPVAENEMNDAIGIQRNTAERRELTIAPIFIPPHTLQADEKKI